jgi:hypothetical protein
MPFLDEWGGERVWELAVNPAVPLDLDVDMGAGRVVVDLQEATLSDLDVDMGAGEVIVTLAEKGPYDCDLSAGVGNVVVVIPEGLEVRIRTDAAILNTHASGSLIRSGDTYQTPGYGSADDRVDLRVELAVGNLTIETE